MSTSDIDRVLRDAVTQEAVPHIVATATESMFRNQIGALDFPTNIPTADPVMASTWEGPSGMKWGHGLLLTTEEEPGYRSPGSEFWAGLFNTYFWVDPRSELSGAIYSQFVPFADPAILGVCRDVEKHIYRSPGGRV